VIAKAPLREVVTPCQLLPAETLHTAVDPPVLGPRLSLDAEHLVIEGVHAVAVE